MIKIQMDEYEVLMNETYLLHKESRELVFGETERKMLLLTQRLAQMMGKGVIT